MRVYVGTKKEGHRILQGITIYSDKGELLYTDSMTMRDDLSLKFSKDMKSLLWGVRKLKSLCQNKVLSDTENIILFITSKTVYKWIEEENSPRDYVEDLSDLMLELSCHTNDIEIIQTNQSRVIFKEKQKEQEKFVKVTELFK